MQRALLGTFIFFLTCTISVADSGGPDEFGYIWIDSNESGGPAYEWIDVTSTGTIVTGLDDDVCVGPFSIGFPFRYYWYEVDDLYIGSNGYIIFGEAANLSQPFPAEIPLFTVPNDFISPYTADWIPGQAGGTDSTLIWTNSLDSCIVSFVNYPAYITGGSHTFQIILTNSDSSVTFQYADQQGLVMNNDVLIGIESQTGQIGLEHSHDQYIAYEYSTVKFDYPDNISIVIRDLSASSVANQYSTGIFQLTGSYFHPWGVVDNVGIQSEQNFSTAFSIYNPTGSPVYSQMMTFQSTINPNDPYENYFLPMWIPAETGQYFLTYSVSFTEDMNVHNDTIRTECHVVDLPGTLYYDDGSAESAWRWEGGQGGIAQRFVPPAYYARIDSLILFIAEAGGTANSVVELLDDDGEDGSPGSILYTAEIPTPLDDWYSIDLTTQNIVIEEGAFYVAWHMLNERTPGLGLDTSSDQLGSRQSWEFTSMWLPFREAEHSDPMIRCAISAVAPPNQPPQIIDYNPVYLDTTISDPELTFWGSAVDPDQDPLTWEWRLDGEVVGTDSIVTIQLVTSGLFEVIGRVSDSEFADSVIWHLTGLSPVLGEQGGPFPAVFNLYPVFPNPFNPDASIIYQLPAEADVRLAVYDLGGREILILADARQHAGRHNIKFNGSKLASGIYFIKLDTDFGTILRKAVLIK